MTTSRPSGGYRGVFELRRSIRGSSMPAVPFALGLHSP
jgi:hypothetical protein